MVPGWKKPLLNGRERWPVLRVRSNVHNTWVVIGHLSLVHQDGPCACVRLRIDKAMLDVRCTLRRVLLRMHGHTRALLYLLFSQYSNSTRTQVLRGLQATDFKQYYVLREGTIPLICHTRTTKGCSQLESRKLGAKRSWPTD